MGQKAIQLGMRGVAKMAALAVMAVVLVVCCLPAGVAQAATNKDTRDYKLALTAAAAATYCDNLFLKNNYKKLDSSFQGDSGVLFGNAGGLLGYVDEDIVYDNYTFNFFIAPTSMAASSYSYAAFESASNGMSDSATVQAIDGYARYGWALRELGFDQTSYNTNAMLRSMAGSALTITWQGARMADNIFEWCVTMLARINPFALLTGYSNANMEWANGDGAHGTGGLEVDLGAGEQLIDKDTGGGGNNNPVNFLTSLYNLMSGVGVYIMVPLFFALLIWFAVIGRALFGAKTNITRIRNFIVRLVFIVVGVPMLALAYTGALNSMVSQFEVAKSVNPGDGAKTEEMQLVNVDYVVLESLIDFEHWAQNANLAWPTGGADLIVKRNGMSASVAPETLAQVRKTAVAVNIGSYPNGQAALAYLEDGSATMRGEGSNSDLDFGLTRDPSSIEGGTSTDNAGEGQMVTSEDVARDLLSRFSEGETYTPSEYETYVKVKLAHDDPEAIAQLGEWLHATQNPGNFATVYASTDQMKSSVNGDEWKGEDKGAFKDKPIERSDNGNSSGDQTFGDKADELFKKIGTDGYTLDDYLDDMRKLYDMEWAAKEDNTGGESGDKTLSKIEWLHDGTATASVGSDSIRYPGTVLNSTAESGSYAKGLSTIGMFNYLSTDFSGSGLSVFSDQAVNEQSRASHYSVNAFGGGAYGWLVVANAVSVLLLMLVMGLVYGVGLLFTNLKRGFQLIISLPFALMGMIQSIARVLLLGICMLVEVFAVCSLYFLLRGIIWSVNEWLIGLAPGLFAMMGIDAGSISMASIFASLILGTIAMIAMIYFVLRTRRAVVNGLTELVSSVITRIVGASGGSAAQANVAGTLGQAAAGTMAVGKIGGSAAAGAAMLGVGGAGAAAAVSAFGGSGGDASSADLTSGLSKTGADRSEGTIEEPDREPGAGAVGGAMEREMQSTMEAKDAVNDVMSQSSFGQDAYDRDVMQGEGMSGASTSADASADSSADGGMSGASAQQSMWAAGAGSDAFADGASAEASSDSALYSDGGQGQVPLSDSINAAGAAGSSSATADANAEGGRMMQAQAEEGASAQGASASATSDAQGGDGQAGFGADGAQGASGQVAGLQTDANADANLSASIASANQAELARLASQGAANASALGYNASGYSQMQLANAELSAESAYGEAKAQGMDDRGAAMQADNALMASLDASAQGGAGGAGQGGAGFGMGGLQTASADVSASADAVHGFDADRDVMTASAEAGEVGSSSAAIANMESDVSVSSDGAVPIGDSIAMGRMEGSREGSMAMAMAESDSDSSADSTNQSSLSLSVDSTNESTQGDAGSEGGAGGGMESTREREGGATDRGTLRNERTSGGGTSASEGDLERRGTGLEGRPGASGADSAKDPAQDAYSGGTATSSRAQRMQQWQREHSGGAGGNISAPASRPQGDRGGALEGRPSAAPRPRAPYQNPSNGSVPRTNRNIGGI